MVMSDSGDDGSEGSWAALIMLAQLCQKQHHTTHNLTTTTTHSVTPTPSIPTQVQGRADPGAARRRDAQGRRARGRQARGRRRRRRDARDRREAPARRGRRPQEGPPPLVAQEGQEEAQEGQEGQAPRREQRRAVRRGRLDWARMHPAGRQWLGGDRQGAPARASLCAQAGPCRLPSPFIWRRHPPLYSPFVITAAILLTQLCVLVVYCVFVCTPPPACCSDTFPHTQMWPLVKPPPRDSTSSLPPALHHHHHHHHYTHTQPPYTLLVPL